MIVGNRSVLGTPFGTDVGGVGVVEFSYADVRIENSILRGNSGAQVDPLHLILQVRYSNVEGGHAGPGNFDAPPRFVDAAAGDYHLRPDSPCVDAGDPARLDPDGSRSDVGAYPLQSLYDLENVLRKTWSDPSWPRLSVQVGGHQTLKLNAGPQYAGYRYVVVGSLSGTSPGVVAQGLHVPLNPDAYTLWTLYFPALTPLVGGMGTLDANGVATVRFEVPPGQEPGLAGTTLHHAFGLFRQTRLQRVSNPLEVVLVP